MEEVSVIKVWSRHETEVQTSKMKYFVILLFFFAHFFALSSFRMASFSLFEANEAT